MRKILKIVISIIYILWGIASPLTAWNAITSFDIAGLAVATVGVLTLLAGIFGLIGIKKMKCRIFGIVIFACSVASIIIALPTISIQSIITAVLTWLYIACV